MPRATSIFPAVPLLVVEAQLRRGRRPRDAAAVDLQPRLGDGLGGVEDDAGRRGPAVHRDGLAPHPRVGRGRRSAGGLHRRVHRHLQPGRRAAATASPPPAPARTASPCSTTPSADAFVAQVESLGAGTTLLVDTYDVREAVADAVEVAGPGLGAVRLDSGDLGVLAHEVRAAARRPRRARDPDHRHFRPRRARDRGTGRGPCGRLRRRHLAGHRQRAPHLRLRLQAGLPRGRPTASWSTWPRLARRRSRSAAASGRCVVATIAGVAEAEVVGDRRSLPPTTATTGRCWCRWCAAARSSGREPCPPPASGTQRARDELPVRARQLSRGEPVIPTLMTRQR